MQHNVLIVVLLVSLLIFGCTSQPSGGAVPPAQGGAPQGQPSGGPAGTPPVNQTPPSNASAQPPGGQPSGLDLTGKSYTELLALGVPIKCEISTESGTVTLYKGLGSDMRSEMPATEGMCQGQKLIFIVKSDKYYMGCGQGPLIQGSSCQWLVFSTTGTTGGTGTGYQQPDYSSVSAAQINCVPWVPDESMLQAPANACTMADLIPTG